jgi:ATP-dependent Lhr-like helicase
MVLPQFRLDFQSDPGAVDPALAVFHPVVQRWFSEQLGAPTEPQRRGWPLIQQGHDVLIAAPTGSGKTLAAFLPTLDGLLRDALAGQLADETRVLYVSPLKALSNDVQKNLEEPLAELCRRAEAQGHPRPGIRAQVRTGDTPAAERQGLVRRPPHILITTPESLYLYLTSPRARATLRTVRTIVVDEIHAVARDKRGSHLTLSLERLKALTRARPQLIGLSATQKPLERIAAFLCGPSQAECRTVQAGHVRPWDLTLETPDDELSSLATHEMWGQVYDRLVELVKSHRTTLVFTNTRKLAERVAHDLGERLGKETCAAHHGSLSREIRLAAEERLKRGQLKLLAATASLELGIDIGAVDLVVQLGSPRSIATLLQRVGRANHHKDGISKGILFAMTRDELVEGTALLRAVKEGLLDQVLIPEKPLDILAQQIVSACAAEDWEEDALFTLVRRAYPYHNLTREEFDQVLTLLSEGVSSRRGRARVHLHRDRVNGILRARKGARLLALTNGGAIPDTFNYPVVNEADGKVVGSLDEDYATESMAGDIFLLGSTSWRITRVTTGEVRVENAHGLPPNIPFWRGEAPARTLELSYEVGRLREDLLRDDTGLALLTGELGLPFPVADQLMRYLRSAERALGTIPSWNTVVAERFFDEAGGMQLILHAPFGARINRAWGLALRKRFCRSFDFELQAAATDDGILLSLGEQHSFPLADIFDFLTPQGVEEVLTQAVLQAPLFGTRFRWNASRALALQRMQGGKRVPPPLQRARAEDLLAAVFPAQVGCQDNHGGEDVEVPDHPLVKETLENCLREAMDVDGLKEVLAKVRDGRVQKRAQDVPEPSPLAHQLIHAQPYAFLDDAPAEERRTRAVSLRRSLPPEDAVALGALDADAITRVTSDAVPLVRDAEELHDLLLQFVLLREGEARMPWVAELVRQRRAAFLEPASAERFIVAAERVPHVQALFPGVALSPELQPLPGDAPLEREEAGLAVVRGRMEVCGPTSVGELSALLTLPPLEVEAALLKLEAEGQVLRGRFRPGTDEAGLEWCDRRLLQRIHRLTVGRLRKEIEPLHAADFMRFLFRWHGMTGPAVRGDVALLTAIDRLQGFEAPAAGWERALLPARVPGYRPDALERACWSGEVAWGRLTLREGKAAAGPRRGRQLGPEDGPSRARPSRAAPMTFARREAWDWLLWAARRGATWDEGRSEQAASVVAVLERRGACFFADLVAGTRHSAGEVEDALWELVTRGEVTADGVENLRVLQSPRRRREQRASRRGGMGRWTLVRPVEAVPEAELHERLARLFLGRYGIVWRDAVVREPLSPSWRELLFVYRRLEARGEVRGGRFLADHAGEQFALPEAVDLARAVRRTPRTGERVEVSAVDPLNLTGLVGTLPRVPAVLGAKVTFVDGVAQKMDAVTEGEVVADAV